MHFLLALQGLVSDNATSLAGAGILAVQVLLLWRVRRVELEQEYQARVSHWENNVLQLICFNLKVEIPDRPERRGG